MNYRVIKVLESNIRDRGLKIGDDIGGLGLDDYVIENIGQPYTDDEGWQMVRLTLVKRSEKVQ